MSTNWIVAGVTFEVVMWPAMRPSRASGIAATAMCGVPGCVIAERSPVSAWKSAVLPVAGRPMIPHCIMAFYDAAARSATSTRNCPQVTSWSTASARSAR